MLFGQRMVADPTTLSNDPACEIIGTNARKYPAMSKLIALQRRLESLAMNTKTEAKDASSCARTWVELEKLRMIKQGKPITTMPAQALKLPKARKMGYLRPVSPTAQIVDIVAEPTPVEEATVKLDPA
jgi:hypothetical protein